MKHDADFLPKTPQDTNPNQTSKVAAARGEGPRWKLPETSASAAHRGRAPDCKLFIEGVVVALSVWRERDALLVL